MAASMFAHGGFHVCIFPGNVSLARAKFLRSIYTWYDVIGAAVLQATLLVAALIILGCVLSGT